MNDGQAISLAVVFSRRPSTYSGGACPPEETILAPPTSVQQEENDGVCLAKARGTGGV